MNTLVDGPRLNVSPRQVPACPRPLAAALCLMGCALAPVGAADPGPLAPTNVATLKRLSLEDLMKLEVATVTTASKKAEKATDAPATVIVITANDIRLRGYSNLKDVLRDLPGMETIEYYFSEIGTQVPVRGISGNNKIIVLLNGMRVNPPGGENVPLRSDFSVREAERIEIIYGPGSTLYGQDAISAVINVITRKPGDSAGGEAGGAAGVHNEREAWGSFGGPLDKDGHVTLSGYAQYHESDLTRLDREYPAWWQFYKDLAAPRGSGTVPYRDDFGVNVFGRLDAYDSSLQVWHRQSRRSSSEGGYPPAYVKEAEWQDMSTVAEGQNTSSLSESTKLESTVTFNRYEIDPDSRYVFNVPGVDNAWFLNDYKYGIGWNASLEETLKRDLTETLSLLAGVVATYNDIAPKATYPGGADPHRNLVAQGGSFVYTTPDDPATRHAIPRVSEVTYWTYAAYMEAGWQALDRLRAIGGVRVTRDDRFDDTPITPRVALIYDLSANLTAKYIYTRAYVAPAPYFAYATYDNGTLLATTNPELKPETAETHEVNLVYTKENVCVGASVFYGTQNDIITISDRNAAENVVAPLVYLDGDPSQPRTLVHTANGGDSRRYGADTYARATVGPLSPWVSYSYVDFEEHLNGKTSGLPGISSHNGRLGATWAVTPKLSVSPSLVIRSTPQNVQEGALGSELDRPWEVDLYALYSLGNHADVFADLRNVTDHHYALGGISGSAVPQETFHGTIGLKLTF